MADNNAAAGGFLGGVAIGTIAVIVGVLLLLCLCCSCCLLSAAMSDPQSTNNSYIDYN